MDTSFPEFAAATKMRPCRSSGGRHRFGRVGCDHGATKTSSPYPFFGGGPAGTYSANVSFDRWIACSWSACPLLASTCWPRRNVNGGNVRWAISALRESAEYRVKVTSRALAAGPAHPATFPLTYKSSASAAPASLVAPLTGTSDFDALPR